MSDRVSTTSIILWSLVAACGGIVRTIAGSLEQRNTIRITVSSMIVYALRLLATGFVAGFTGLMMALLVSQITQNQEWQYIAAGVSGYSGPKTLDLIFESVRRRFLPAHDPLSR